MKRVISLTLFMLIICTTLCSCTEQKYTLNESQMDSIFSSSTDIKQKVRPPFNDIEGIYSIKYNGEDYNVFVTRYGDKMVIQILKSNVEISPLKEAVLENIETEYSEETGKFYQSYVSDDRTSIYEAYFSVEEGRVKIDLYNTYFFHNEGTLYSGIKAIGYKQ